MVATRRQSALAQLPTPAVTSPAKTGQLDDGYGELDGPLTDLEDEDHEEEDYDEDVEMLSDSASDDSGSDWEENGSFSRLDIETQ